MVCIRDMDVQCQLDCEGCRRLEYYRAAAEEGQCLLDCPECPKRGEPGKCPLER